MTAWYCVYSQPHGEARATEHLRRQGYEVFLPRYRRWHSHARKRQLVWRPLFPRYLFVSLDPETQRWRPILSTSGVAGMVLRGELPAPVPDGIVDALRQREDATGAIIEHDAVRGLKPGDAVRVTEGPFAELVGRLYAFSERARVSVLLDILGREVRAEVPARALAPA